MAADPSSGCSRLEELNLEQNQLTDLDEDVFACHVQNHYLVHYYEYNDEYYLYFSLKRNLLELNLGGNRLTALPGGLFNGFTKLRTLQLQSNQLVRLPPTAVSDSRRISLGVHRTLEYVMQGDSLIFSVTSHFSNKIIVLYVKLV